MDNVLYLGFETLPVVDEKGNNFEMELVTHGVGDVTGNIYPLFAAPLWVYNYYEDRIGYFIVVQ